MLHLQKIFICFLFIQTASATFTGLYSIEDLEILHSQKNYKEFFQHIRDIRPKDRKNHWREMIYEMSELYIQELSSKKLYTKKNFQYLESIAQWPVMKNNEIFNLKKSNFSIAYFERCFTAEAYKDKGLGQYHQNPCVKDIITMWNNTLTSFVNIKLGIRLASIIEKWYPKINTWFFYAPIITNKFSGPICQNKHILEKFLNEHVASSNIFKYPTKAKSIIDKYLSKACWTSFIPNLKSIILSNDSHPLKNEAFLLLKAHNNLNTLESDLFLLTFILNNPKKGPLFNQAWTAITNLGKTFKRRERVMAKIKNLKTLPGKLFKTSNKKRLFIIISFLSKNIPEYFNHYAKTCISYLQGNIKTNRGNPTPGCHELFRMPKNNKWISSELIRTYNEIL